MFEQFLYESRPFAFLATAIASFVKAPNLSTNIFAFLLAVCMLMVLYWRYENRYTNTSPARRRPRK